MLKLQKYFLFLSLIIFTSSKQPDSDYCQKIECNSDLDPKTCVKVEATTSLMNPCQNSTICEIIIEDPVIDSFCVENNITLKKLPSLPCNSDDECLNGTCSSGQCLGINDGDPCNYTFQCYYGKTCRKNDDEYLCLDPLKEGDECEKDTDCDIDCGCMKGLCTKYFSLDNNEDTGGSDYNSDFTFCKSGYVSEVGICMNISLQNDTTECSDLYPCKYNYYNEEHENRTIIIHSNCLCGYNPFGKRYCLLGSGNLNYTKYLNKLKEYHLNNQNCHLSERTAHACQKDLLSNSKEVLSQINELIHAKYWAKSNNRLIDAPECVFGVEFPGYDRSIDKNPDPEPINDGQCAKYICEKAISDGICASSNYLDDFNINVTLADICTDNAKCKLNGDPNDVFYNKTNVIGNCSSNVFNMRYPGEDCEIDSDCVYPLNNTSSQFHVCEEGICNGITEDGICEDHSWCVVGYYCDFSEGKCKEQIKKGEKCSESKSCKNDLICRNGICDELFSAKDGDSVPETESIEFQKKFCENGEVMENKCVSYNDFDGTKLNDNEYKTCNFNSYCEYKINGLGEGRKKYVRCGCGYNAEGQGYCPHFHDYSKSDWEEYRKIIKDKSDNNCHTESRFNCYETENEEESELKTYKNKLENGHLFYKSVECAKKVLSGNYLNNKKIIYIFFGILILLF